MVAIARRPMRTPTGRRVRITAIDAVGRPAPASVEILIDGEPAGQLELGSGNARAVHVTVHDPRSVIELQASFLAETFHAELPPGVDHADFQFSGVARFAVASRPQAICPDGKSGSPCVQCTGKNGKKWEMCC